MSPVARITHTLRAFCNTNCFLSIILLFFHPNKQFIVEKLKPLKDSLGWEDSDALVDRSVWGKICYFFLTAS